MEMRKIDEKDIFEANHQNLVTETGKWGKEFSDTTTNKISFGRLWSAHQV